VQRDTGRLARLRGLLDGLLGADLVVRAHQRGQRDSVMRIAGTDRRGERVQVDPAGAVDPDRVGLAAGGGVALRGAQDGGVLHRGVHQYVPGPAAALEAAQHGQVGGLGAAGAEAHLVRPRADDVGDHLPRRVQQLTGPAGDRVPPLRVGPAVVQRGEQRPLGHRVQRRRGGGVQIGQRVAHGGQG
jgi:hypothetical protein